MQIKTASAGVLLAAMLIAIGSKAGAQAPPPAPGSNTPSPARGGSVRRGGFVPGQSRPPGDPAQVARGNTLYGINCTSCHGSDLRGGDKGGPNLLRSQTALSDRNGELLVPAILNSHKNLGVSLDISRDDSLAVSAYIRSVLETIGGQGKPPSAGQAPPSILVGDAQAGQTYFAAKCGSCHSATGDLQGLASKFADPVVLQNRWIAGGGRFGRSTARTVTVTVAMPAGEKVEGNLIRIDDFLVTVQLADGTQRTIRRNGAVPKVDVHDPMQTHRDLLSVYTDKDIHDVTAYLVTLK